jgi:acyl carrier protein
LDRQAVVAKLEAVFAKVFGKPVAVRDSLTAAEVPGWDSLANIRLIDAIEREFKISFSATEVMGLDTVGTLVTLIHAKVPR